LLLRRFFKVFEGLHGIERFESWLRRLLLFLQRWLRV